MLNLKTEKELIQFLKIVSEEAVMESKRRINEEIDPYVNSFKRNMENDGLLEQESEDEEEEAEEEEDPITIPVRAATAERADMWLLLLLLLLLLRYL